MKCNVCGKENEADVTQCSTCGSELEKEVVVTQVEDIPTVQDDDEREIKDETEQVILEQHSGNQQQFTNNQYRNPNEQLRKIPQLKSKDLATILNIFFPGFGYCYLGQWVKGVIIYLIVALCLFLSVLIIPLIIAVILWIHCILDVRGEVDKYNKDILQ